jgi:ElaA protein
MSAGSRATSVESLPSLVWRCASFDDLSARELHGIHRARQRVFVVEQGCAFLDADAADELARHLTGLAAGGQEPLAYARLLPPGAKYEDASIGRVLTAFSVRGLGLGRQLMQRALSLVASTWPGAAVRISAQSRLEPFYASFGFAPVGDRYLEDGIDHTEMVLSAEATAAF